MIIGVSGYKGSGKDTFSDHLVNKYGFEKISFAAKLKESASNLFGVEPAFWEKFKNIDQARVTISVPSASVGLQGPNILVSDMSVRQMLQRYGTESHRDVFGPDFWVNEALKPVGNGDFVIPDCRFENEARRIISLGGVIVRIKRGSNIGDGHASEALFSDSLVDYWVDNTGDLENLYRQAEEIVESIDEEKYEDQYGDFNES